MKRYTEKLNNGSYDYMKGRTMFEFSGDREEIDYLYNQKEKLKNDK
jgi:hypothetical protein